MAGNITYPKILETPVAGTSLVAKAAEALPPARICKGISAAALRNSGEKPVSGSSWSSCERVSNRSRTLASNASASGRCGRKAARSSSSEISSQA